MIVVVIISLLLFLLLRGLMNTSKDKIYSDHDRYERFRNECLAEREILEIEKDINLKTAGRQLYWNIPAQINLQGESTRLGSGESKTIDILKTYSNVLVTVIVCLTVISLALLINKYL
jgi:hypothetical protein